MERIFVYADEEMEYALPRDKKLYDLCYDAFEYDYSWDMVMIKEAWLLHVDNYSQNYQTEGLKDIINNFDIVIMVKTRHDNTIKVSNHFTDIEF
jgi:hypothetical protein